MNSAPSGKLRESASEADKVSGAITYRELRRLVFITLGLLALYQVAIPLTTLLLVFVLVVVIAAAVNPAVVWLERHKIPRQMAVLLLISAFLAALLLLGWRLLPPLLSEFDHLVASLGKAQEKLTGQYRTLIAQHPDFAAQLPKPDELGQQLSPRLIPILGRFGQYTLNAAVGLLSVALMVVLIAYTLAAPVPLLAGLLGAVPAATRPRVERALMRIMRELGYWAQGSVVLGVVIGLMTAAGLWLLGRGTGHPFPNIMLFALVAGIGEMVPSIGPVLSAIPPVIVAAGIDPGLAVWVVVLFIVIQQLENHLIVPLVMGKALDFPPLAIIFSVLVMGTLFGLLGAVLALPTCTIFRVCWEEIRGVPTVEEREQLEHAALRIVGTPAPQPHGSASSDQSDQSDDEPCPPN
jgi:predicted PurR-regulated permease PerM